MDKQIEIWIDYAEYGEGIKKSGIRKMDDQANVEMIREFADKLVDWLEKTDCGSCDFKNIDYKLGKTVQNALCPSCIIMDIEVTDIQDIETLRKRIVTMLPQWEEEMQAKMDSGAFCFSPFNYNLGKNYDIRSDRFEQAVKIV